MVIVYCEFGAFTQTTNIIDLHVFYLWWDDASLGFVIYPSSAVLITAILPALWLYVRIRHRTRPGHCVACGYNLKGTIEAGRTECPECGKEIEAKA